MCNKKYEANDVFVSKLLNKIETHQLALFCGAGISFNSGLPIVNQLLDYLYETLQLSRQEKEKLFESNIPFERIMETILIESDINEIKEIFTTGAPNANHLIIAKMAKSKLVKTIYTTNFDLLIEKALEAYGLLEGVHFRVYRTEKELKNIEWAEDVIRIIKIHGCASEMDEMAITLGKLASNRYLDLRKKLLSKIFSADITDSVLIMGYSCSDFDIVPLISALEDKTSKIYFVDHSSTDCRLDDVSLKDFKNPFKEYKGLRYIGDTNNIIKSVCKHLDFSISDYIYLYTLKNGCTWYDNVDAWYKKNIQVSGQAFPHQVVAKMLYSIGAFHAVLSHIEQAIKKNYKQENWIAYASNLDTMGMACNKLGRYDDAGQYFKKTIAIQRQLDDDLNLASMIQSYGNVLHQQKKDSEAIVLFKEALNISRIHEDKSLESNILGNISNSYRAKGQFLMAKHSIVKALEISSYLGNKQAESSQLGMLSSVYLFSGQPHKALQPLLDAIEIKKTIADYDELCKLYLNLTTVYNLTANFSKSKETAQKGLSLARKIGNEQRINEFYNAILIYSI